MRLFKKLLALALLASAIWIARTPGVFLPAHVRAAIDPKGDQQCNGSETAGRCADKCPQGSYQIGRDDETGAAICHLQPTGCPYGDSIPLGPECDKAAPTPTPTPVEFFGK